LRTGSLSSGPSSAAPKTDPVTSESEFRSDQNGMHGERKTLVLQIGAKAGG
jgi:hypothetical protein